MAAAEVPNGPHNHVTMALLGEFFGLAAIVLGFTALRIYVSFRITRFFDWADYTIYTCAALLIVNAAFAVGEVSNLFYIKNAEYHHRQLRKWSEFSQIVIVLITLLTKYSIGLFILRIRCDRRVKIFIGTILLPMTLATIATIVMLCIACIPPRKLWTSDVKGHCYPLASVYIVSYVQSGFTIVTDLAFTISPIVILWNVRIPRGRKTFIISLMSLGLIATISCAARTAFIPGLTGQDFTFNAIWINVLYPLETCCGIIAANIPACAPVITRRKFRQSARELNSAGHLLPSRQPSRSTDLTETDYIDGHSASRLS